MEEHPDLKISFDDIETAFESKTDKQLRFSYFIFRLLQNRFLVGFFSRITLVSLKLGLPVKPFIRATMFRQFCGGETIEECKPVISGLGKAGIGSILDYSLEGKQHEDDFDKTKEEILRIIQFAKDNPDIPCTSIKLTSIVRFNLLEKASGKSGLTDGDQLELERARRRLVEICTACRESHVSLFIDAEESWIQGAIDVLAEDMMAMFNERKAVVYTTAQLYRHDRLVYLEELISKTRSENIILGIKLVRGAYLEKENDRAEERNYPTPIHASKEATDRDFNKSLELVLKNIDVTAVCAGTHNEGSCIFLADLMRQRNIENGHPHIQFSQLYGMSDHISYLLAGRGYNVTKYLPYGPVQDTVPYLIRRAEENTAIAGQMAKELVLLKKEMKRRQASKGQVRHH